MWLEIVRKRWECRSKRRQLLVAWRAPSRTSRARFRAYRATSSFCVLLETTQGYDVLQLKFDNGIMRLRDGRLTGELNESEKELVSSVELTSTL